MNMKNKERFFSIFTLSLIAILASFDVFTDFRQGAALEHTLLESVVGLTSLAGAFYLIKGALNLKKQLAKERSDFLNFKEEAEIWRSEHKKYIDGLSQAIDQQLAKWQLTMSEKEVAFLLLKGLSLKEIANIRNTTEKTARTQSVAIYQKAGLMGRSELAAFFLEDLLLPTAPLNLQGSEN